MTINKKDFPEIIPDNEEVFFSHLIGIIESIDEISSLQITKKGKGYHFRIVPSLPRYTNSLILEISQFCNMFGIHLEFSKSIKTSGSLAFSIEI